MKQRLPHPCPLRTLAGKDKHNSWREKDRWSNCWLPRESTQPLAHFCFVGGNNSTPIGMVTAAHAGAVAHVVERYVLGSRTLQPILIGLRHGFQRSSAASRNRKKIRLSRFCFGLFHR